jgi:hypothetical protein
MSRLLAGLVGLVILIALGPVADEQEFADQFAPLMQRLEVNIPVTLVPNMKHADMISAPAALQAGSGGRVGEGVAVRSPHERSDMRGRSSCWSWLKAA